jgi:hypothetical protein
MFFPSLNKVRPQGQSSNFMTKTKPGSEPVFWKLKIRGQSAFFMKRKMRSDPEFSDPGLMNNKKAAGFAAGGFSFDSSASAAVSINASRIALRDVLCADQLSYARLHGRHG